MSDMILFIFKLYMLFDEFPQAAARVPQSLEPGVFGAEHVGFAVTDEVGFRAVDAETRTGFVDEAGRGFAAGADFAVFGELGFGMMRAVVEGVEVGADFSEFRVHPVVDAFDVALGVEAAGHAALICHEDGEKALVVDVLDGLFCAVYPDEVLGTVQVVNVDIQRAVAVEKYGLIFHIRSNRRCRGTSHTP